MQTVTLSLPDNLLQQLQCVATALHSPLDLALTKLMLATFQGVDDAPPDMQAELAQMAWQNDQDLWQIARSQMSLPQQALMQQLAEYQAAHPLTSGENETLSNLRVEYTKVLLRKARAHALLSLRSGRALLENA